METLLFSELRFDEVDPGLLPDDPVALRLGLPFDEDLCNKKNEHKQNLLKEVASDGCQVATTYGHFLLKFAKGSINMYCMQST